MKQITINLLTKEEAELFCKRFYSETRIMPVTLHEGDDWNVYYTVIFLDANNKWVPVKAEWL